jgi:hypothetical protein
MAFGLDHLATLLIICHTYNMYSKTITVFIRIISWAKFICRTYDTPHSNGGDVERHTSIQPREADGHQVWLWRVSKTRPQPKKASRILYWAGSVGSLAPTQARPWSVKISGRVRRPCKAYYYTTEHNRHNGGCGSDKERSWHSTCWMEGS